MTSSRVTDLDDFRQKYEDLFDAKGPKRTRSKRDAGDAKSEQETDVKASAAKKMADLMLREAAELWHSPGGEPFATFGEDGIRKHYAVRGSDFAELMQRRNYLEHGTAPAGDAVKAAVNVIAGEAKYAGEMYPVYSRTAQHDGAVWVDLGDETWRAVRIHPDITPDGWCVVDSTEVPVKFRRLSSMRSIPAPEPGGSIDHLRTLFQLDDTEWMLLAGWMIGVFQESGARAFLEMIGQQGSGKSTLARELIRLLDPCEIPSRSVSRNEEELLIAVQGRAVLAYDNVSTLHPDMADAWCRMSTGGGIGKRKLFSDSEETLIKAQLPLVWTSIVPVAINRPDLQDRTITVRLEPLGSDSYRSEREINSALDAMRPGILGALYSTVAVALRNQDTIRLERLPRLADFATWVEAAAPALGWESGDFTTALESSSMRASYLAIDASPVGRLTVAFMKENSHWQGPTSDLLTELRELASDDDKRQRQFPKDSARLGVQLRRMQRPLADLGVWVGFDRSRRANVVILDRNDAVFERDAEPPERDMPVSEPAAQQASFTSAAGSAPTNTERTARDWLYGQLEDGPVPKTEVLQRATDAGIQHAILQGVRFAMGVRTASRDGIEVWQLDELEVPA